MAGAGATSEGKRSTSNRFSVNLAASLGVVDGTSQVGYLTFSSDSIKIWLSGVFYEARIYSGP